MAFNWFRRQYNEPSKNDSEEQQETLAVTEEVKSEPTATPAATTAANADLLAYAKAAYKNIQQKQQTGSEEISPKEESKDTPDTGETAIAETATPTASEETTQTANVALADDFAISIESVAPLEQIEEKTPASLSFFEKATADNLARLEELKVDEPDVTEPEVTNPSTFDDTETVAETTEQDDEIAFDEGFIWSAEVLARQGRKIEDVSADEINWLQKLRRGLSKTRRGIINQLKSIVGKGPLNQAGVTEIESLLLQADVGVEATDYIIDALQIKLREEALPPEQAIAYLKQILQDILDEPIKKSQKPAFYPEKENLNIWLITGVNGAGKTTTIGKLSNLANKSGYRCLIGAADTFRAAAVEQVKVWGTRSGVEVISNPGKNTDPAAVVFDAITAAVARNTELLLVDTAGRLQNKKNLMDELSKIRRIIDKKAPNAKVESLLVLDATLGQNGLRQAEVFSQAAQLSGVVLTKLDGSAKGGVALAVVRQLGLPIRFIGAGEGIEDLRPFSSYEFVEALLSG